MVKNKRYRNKITAFMTAGALFVTAFLSACGSSELGTYDSVNGITGNGTTGDSTTEGESGSAEGNSTGSGSDFQEENSSETGSDSEGESSSGKESEINYADLIDISKMPHIDPEDYPKVDGSTATLPLSVELYSLTTGVSRDEAEHTINHTKTRYAYSGLVEKGWVTEADGKETNGYQTDLVLAYEPSEEIQKELDDSGVELLKKPIGRDALVFLVNEGNPVKSLSQQQIVGIYSGSTRNWSEVGGEDKPIDAFQRPQNSGSQTLMEKLVMRGTEMMHAPSYKTPTEMGELIESVSGYDNSSTAIGYSVYYYAHNMYDMPGLRLLEVGGVAPSNETIRDGDYPYVNDFYAVIRKDEPENSPARQLFDWLTEDGGQQLLNAMGYVSVRDVGDTSQNDAPGGDSSNENQSSRNGGQSGSSSGWLVQQSGYSFDLGENGAILMNGAAIADVPEVVILDEGLHEKDVIRGVSLESDSFEIVDLTEPAIFVHTDDGKRGLYDLRKKKWLLDPDYDYISKVAGQEETYEAWKYAQWNEKTQSYDGDDLRVIWKNGKTTEQKEAEGAVRVGSYTWSAMDADGNVTITDSKGNTVKVIPFSQDGLSTGYESGDYYVAWTESSEPILFDARGNVIFTRETLQDKISDIIGSDADPATFQMEFNSCENGIVNGSFWKSDPSYVEYGFLYKLSDSTLLTGEKVRVSTVYADDGYAQKSCYVVSNLESSIGRDRYVLDPQGKQMLAADGTPYEHALSGGLFAYTSGEGKFVVESRDGSEYYELDAAEEAHLDDDYEPIGQKIAKGIFSLNIREDDSYHTVLYQGNRKMNGQDDGPSDESSGSGTEPYAYTLGGGYALVSIDNVQSIYEIESGKKVLTLPKGEYYVKAENGVFISNGGIYYYFRDSKGREIGKIASSLEGDD